MYDEVAAVLRLIDTPLLDHIVKLGTAVTWTNAAPVNVALACLESIVPWSLVRRLFSGLLPYDTYWFFAETCLFTAHDFPSAVAFLIACCLKCVRTDVLRSAKVRFLTCCTGRLSQHFTAPCACVLTIAVGGCAVGVQRRLCMLTAVSASSLVSSSDRFGE
jgi:hypothetical protein